MLLRRLSRSHQRQLGIERLEQRHLLTGAPTVAGIFVGSTEWSSAFYDFVGQSPSPELGFSVPAGTSAQTKSLPWFNLDKISIKFSEDVDVDVSDLSLSGVNATALNFDHFWYDSLAYVATWTLASPLPKNSYQIDLNGNGLDPVHDLSGNVLDGEWANNSDTFPSGNGSAGGDFAFAFKVMPGDVNQNSAVETTDYNYVIARIGQSTSTSSYSALADVDGSGAIESQDAQDVWSKLWSTYPPQTPVGYSNDAPSASGPIAYAVTNAMGDVNISLYDLFDDAETSDSQLTYQVLSNTTPELFDVASIVSATGSLRVNAATGQSGRSAITVKATDAAGLWTTVTLVIDVNYSNSPPSIDVDVSHVDGTTFWIVGAVNDDVDNYEGYFVEFTGAVAGRVSVLADGTFSFCVVRSQPEWGITIATVRDLQSEYCSTSEYVGVT